MPHRGRRHPALRLLFRAPVYLYRWRLGGLLGRRFLLLIHTGRRSGALHQTVLEIMEYRAETGETIVMSGFGPNADWLRNLVAHPGAEIVIGWQRFAVAWRMLGPDEAAGVVAGYERRNRLTAPIVRNVLSRLLGWRYAGTEADRRRLVAELPLIAFRPAAASATSRWSATPR